MASEVLALQEMIDGFILLFTLFLQDMILLFTDGAAPLITIILLLMFLTLIGGTILTIFYMIMAALSNSRKVGL